MYGYQAQGSDELDLSEGEMIELTEGPNGGENYADGWWEGTITDIIILRRLKCAIGINMQGKKGIFPSNYVSKMTSPTSFMADQSLGGTCLNNTRFGCDHRII